MTAIARRSYRRRTRIIVAVTAVIAGVCVIAVGYAWWRFTHPTTGDAESYLENYAYTDAEASCRDAPEGLVSCTLIYRDAAGRVRCTSRGTMEPFGFEWIGGGPTPYCP